LSQEHYGARKILLLDNAGMSRLWIYNSNFSFITQGYGCSFFGVTLVGPIQATGTRAIEDILPQEETLARANSFGRDLVALK